MSVIAENSDVAALPQIPLNRRLLFQVPGLIAAFIYLALTLGLLKATLADCGHHLIYSLDDPYIAMAMAKNFAQHGVWGITRFGFTSSSSSPLFTVLLAALYRIFGVSIYLPLAISWCFGAASIFAADRILLHYLSSATHRTMALAAFVIATPLFAVGIVGMESTLHIFLLLLFLNTLDGESSISMAVLSALMTAARYESLFIVVPVSVILALRKDWRKLFAVVCGAAFAILAYGLFSILHGGRIIPDSILLKGAGGGIIGLIVRFLHNGLVTGPHVLLLVAALAAAAPHLWRTQRRLGELTIIVASGGVIHLFVASFGAPFRYEAYIIACGVVVAASILARGSKRSFFTLLILAAAAIGLRSIAAFSVPQYSKAIYDQQWQMARFLSRYFPQSSVAANDIGAISFFTDIHCIDLVGLADPEVFDAKKGNHYTTEFIADHAAERGVKIAIAYDSWFRGNDGRFNHGPPLPHQWVRVARLTTPNPGNLGSETVSFYAVDPQEAARLQQALVKFRPSLPPDDLLMIASGGQN